MVLPWGYGVRRLSKKGLGLLFIQTEDTPNPLAMKFSPGQTMGSREGKTYSKDDATDSLSQSLLSIMGVTNVYYGHNFITVTRDDTSEWLFLKPQILGAIMDFFLESPQEEPEPFHEPELSQKQNPEEDTPIHREIRDIIETRVKPAVAEHGGTIEFHSFEDGIVFLNFKGACSGCPSAELTLKQGVEKMLMHYVPEVIEVRSI